MKPETTEDILELMNGHIVSAVLGTAMELGVFWLLADKPLSAHELAQRLNIPLNRCHYWLQILCKLGLLEDSGKGYALSAIARETILNVQSQDTWAFQAREDRDLFLYVRDLALNISKPMSAWQASNVRPADYFQQIEEDPIYTARFTRKLYQIHTSFAEQLANMLDLRRVKRLLDLGGGSGVVSFALLRKHDELTSVVVDVENVCRAGRVIASENKLEKRITYLAADFLKDDLPIGFDMVMLCDVGSFSEILFRRIHDVLNPKGRLVIVDKFAPSKSGVPPSRLLAAFLTSLESPAKSVDYITMEVVQTRLQKAGFQDFSITSVPHKDNLPWNIDWVMLEAKK
ncbi:MAG TPA: methyltransferase [Anaerolineales bacterium]|nr:methyltransferase [Anaerolineales bacterium]HLO28488.1 methyltransferase [Anaerolineales bacterium]